MALSHAIAVGYEHAMDLPPGTVNAHARELPEMSGGEPEQRTPYKSPAAAFSR